MANRIIVNAVLGLLLPIVSIEFVPKHKRSDNGRGRRCRFFLSLADERLQTKRSRCGNNIRIWKIPYIQLIAIREHGGERERDEEVDGCDYGADALWLCHKQ